MSNHLPNGTVLPHGLLGINSNAAMGAFNKAYKNTSLRMGVVVASYAYNEPGNYSKLATEYDVNVFEQNENISCTNIKYRNCISAEGMGSVADFFEKNLRRQTQNGNPNGEINTSDQNGAIVILLCLDGYTDKAVIIGGLTHPDRQTDLLTTAPILSGEYNGVAVAVNTDGSTALTFKGATNNDGDVIDSSQGTTTASIEVDGTLQLQNSEITIRMDRTNKELTLSSTGNWTVNIQGQTNITTQGEANIIAQGTTTIDGSTIKLGVNAVESVIKGDTFRDLYNAHTHIGNLGFPGGPPLVPMDPSLSLHTFTE